MQFIFNDSAEEVQQLAAETHRNEIYQSQKILCFSIPRTNYFYPPYPVYYIHTNNSYFDHALRKECAAQIKHLCLLLERELKKHSWNSINKLAPKVSILSKNILSKIGKYEDYTDKHRDNVKIMCNTGKRELEEIYLQVKFSQVPKAELFFILDKLLNSEQINECLGGILTVLENTHLAFSFTIKSAIQKACVDRINYDAKIYILKHKLLYMYFDGQNNQTINTEAISHEVHYVAALRNAAAEKFSFLGKNSDTYTTLFPREGDWLQKFVHQYSNNTLLDYFTSQYINDLPDLPTNYDIEIYTHLTKKLDLLGPDHNFVNFLYSSANDQLLLHKNYKLVIRISILKRLLNTGHLQLEPFEAIKHLKIGHTEYTLYLIGTLREYWLEITDDISSTIQPLLSIDLPQFKEVITQLSLGEKEWQQLLLISIVSNNVDLLKLSLQNAKNINICDIEGNYPLILAVIAKSHRTLKKLLNDERIYINSSNASGDTAIATAAYLDDTIALNILLDAGANANLPNAMGYSPLCLAAKEGHINSVRLLAAHPEVNIDFKHRPSGKTIAMLAMEHGQEQTAMLLLTNPGIAYKTDKENQTLLMYSIIHNLPQCFEYLIISSRNEHQIGTVANGYNALMLAAKYDRATFIPKLVEHSDIDINDFSNEDETALIIALRLKHRASIFALLAYPNHDLSRRSKKGESIGELLKELDDMEISAILQPLLYTAQTSSITDIAAYSAGDTEANARNYTERKTRLPKKFGCCVQ